VKAVFLRLLLFVLVIDGFYMYVGQTVTQSEQHPPADLVITEQTDAVALVGMGEELVKNKGGCLICHKIAETGNERGPDLRGVGARAPTRVDGVGGEAYILQSLADPLAYVVEGYPPIMPAANRPPADLSATELKAVAAFLQSLGGEVTVRIDSVDVAAAGARAAAPGGVSPAETYLSERGCTTCHDLRGEERRMGPPLTSVARRLTPGEIRRSIVDPDAVVAEGYAPGLMPKTYGKDLKAEEVDMLVEHLVQAGGPGAGTTPWQRARGLASHPLMQLIALVFVFNAGAWVAMEWLAER
jgi:cytochrome c2